MKHFYKNSYCRVYYVPEKKYIHTHWEGFCPSKVFREASDSIITAMKETGTGRVLFDAVNTKSASPEDQKWLFEEWMPRAIAAGYERYAYILPNDVFGKFTSSNVLKKMEVNIPNIEGATSNDAETALQWLLKES